MEANGYDPARRYTQEEIDELVAKSPYYKATSNDVDWLMKVKMQGRIQKWVDHSISVTINLPNDVDEDLVNRLYVEAWKSGCKGCTAKELYDLLDHFKYIVPQGLSLIHI